MRSRSEELRKRNRRVFMWSLGIAAALHVVVFLIFPAYRVEPLSGRDVEVEAVGRGGGSGTPILVEVLFGTPEILAPDGTPARDSPDRELHASRLLRLHPQCFLVVRPGSDDAPPRGRVRLTVDGDGRADVVQIVESTGDACGDEVVTTVADALSYGWLPSERFPAPVELIQPVTLIRTR